MLLAFYWLIEVKGYRKWTFPLVVVGANSIFIYSLEQVLRGWLNRAIGVFTLKFEWLGDFAPVAQACAVLFVMWYLCYWLYQRPAHPRCGAHRSAHRRSCRCPEFLWTRTWF